MKQLWRMIVKTMSKHFIIDALQSNFMSEMANKVADRVVQIFGGRGYMREICQPRDFIESLE